MHTYRIVVGDYSKDGHNQMDYFTVEVSHPMNEIQKAYKAAVKASGVSVDNRTKAINQLCVDYEDNHISQEAVELLTDMGVKWDAMQNAIEDDGSLDVCGEDLVNIFMEMVRTQLEGFTYKFANEPKCINANSDIGGIGYGCYH